MLKELKLNSQIIGVIVAYLLILISFNSCKSKEVIVDAILIDDLSNIELKLYNDNTFKVSSNYMFGTKEFKGQYEISEDTIKFLDKPYDNNFIPDKVYIFEDKIIFNIKKIDTSFASFFKVRKCNLN